MSAEEGTSFLCRLAGPGPAGSCDNTGSVDIPITAFCFQPALALLANLNKLIFLSILPAHKVTAVLQPQSPAKDTHPPLFPGG